MTYFGFLARFVVLPLLALRALLWLDKRQQRGMPAPLSSWPEDAVLAGHAAVAVTYTTLWDNYLVASKVWGYDPKLVTGLTIGWVPIEEYTFFVLQSLMTGSWMQVLAHRLPVQDVIYEDTTRARLVAVGGLSLVWAAALARLAHDRRDYLGLILGWALPPIMFQVGFGGDILWRNRALVMASIIPATAYLGAADSLAIGAGTWKINPENTVGVEVIRNLPLEELLFFFLTNVLLVFGVTLVQAHESERRIPAFLREPYRQFKARLFRNYSGRRLGGAAPQTPRQLFVKRWIKHFSFSDGKRSKIKI